MAVITAEIVIQRIAIEYGGSILPPLQDLEIANLIRMGRRYDLAAEQANATYIAHGVTEREKTCMERWLRTNPRKRVVVETDSDIGYVGNRPGNGTYDVPTLFSDAFAACKGASGQFGGGPNWWIIGGLAGLLALWGLRRGATA